MTTCSKCKKQPAGEGYKQCDDCRARGRAAVQKHIREHRDAYNARMRTYMRAYSQAVRDAQKDIP
jgi:hypothetical protein